MKHVKFYIATLVIALVAGFLGAHFAGGGASAEQKESVHDKVLRTGVLRCAYMNWMPYMGKNLNTGEVEGLWYDLGRGIEEQLGIKIEYVEADSIAHSLEGIRTGKYDAFCAGMWELGTRAKVVDFTVPFYYDGFYLFARADDLRFGDDFSKINDPSVKVIVLEGELSQYVVTEDFPKATVVMQPGITDASQRLLDIATGKADVTLTEYALFNGYNQNNPGQIKQISERPIRVGAATIQVPKGEHELKAMLNTAIRSLQSTGYVERVLKKYEDETGNKFIRVKKPYEIKK